MEFITPIPLECSPDAKKDVIKFITQHQNYFQLKRTSFFEMTVGMAFSYFKSAKVDYAVIEVGLGGRLDGTNVITPVLSVITNIGLDHIEFLGTSRPQIAIEKAGIIKPSIPVVIGEKDEETQFIFDKIAKLNSAPLYFAESLHMEWETDLKGGYQVKNLHTALTALNHLSDKKIDNKSIKQGFKNVISNTGIQGRWQFISEKPKILLDIGHNKEGISLIVEQLQNLTFNNLHIVLGFVKGKNVNELISLFPEKASIYLSTPKIQRGYPLEILKADLKDSKRKINYFDTVVESFQYANSKVYKNDLVLVCGSTFVVAEILSFLKDEKL